MPAVSRLVLRRGRVAPDICRSASVATAITFASLEGDERQRVPYSEPFGQKDAHSHFRKHRANPAAARVVRLEPLPEKSWNRRGNWAGALLVLRSASHAIAFDCGNLRRSSDLPCKLNFHAPLCFHFGTTSVQVLAGGSLPESCPKNGDLPKSPLLSTGNSGAIG
jgi:hypothetical protein